MEAKINKIFVGNSGIPLTLISINNKKPSVFEKEFSRLGLHTYDYFITQDNGIYRGVNFAWQAMIQCTVDDIRKLYKKWYESETDSEVKNIFAKKFLDEKKEIYFHKECTWEKVGRESFVTAINKDKDLLDLLEKGIRMEIDGNPAWIKITDGAYHFVGLDWIKTAYEKCYKEDNPGDCFITTAVCDSFGKADDCYELTTFRNFRDKWLINQSDGKNLIAEYYEVAPKIVEKINSLANSAEVYKNIWCNYLSTCLEFIEVGENSKCKKIYVDMVNTLKGKFLK